MTILAARYLAVRLPFPFEHKGSKSFARATYPPSLETGQMPLYLTSQPNNQDLFLVGFTMVNYDLAYLAHSQGVSILLSDVTHTLRTLWHALHSPRLGHDPFSPRDAPNLKGTPQYYATLENSFRLDFGKCIRALADLRSSDGVPGAPNGGTGAPFGVVGNAFLERLAEDALLSRLKSTLVGNGNGWGGASAMVASIGGGWNTLDRPGEVTGSAKETAKATSSRTDRTKDGSGKGGGEGQKSSGGTVERDMDNDDWLVV